MTASGKPRWRKLLRPLLPVAIMAALVLGYFGAMRVLGHSPLLNYEVVEKGRLLRSAQPRPSDLDEIRARDGLGTVLSLRGSEEPEIKAWAVEQGVPLLSLKMRADVPPTAHQIDLFFSIMRGDTIRIDDYRDIIEQRANLKKASSFKFPFPVLLHCEGGSDRTGVMVALYRMAFQGWDLALAKEDMMGHFHLPSQHPAQFDFLDRIAPGINADYGSRPTASPAPAAPASP